MVLAQTEPGCSSGDPRPEMPGEELGQPRQPPSGAGAPMGSPGAAGAALGEAGPGPTYLERVGEEHNEVLQVQHQAGVGAVGLQGRAEMKTRL